MLWWVMLVGSAVLMVLVLGLFALVMTRPEWGRRVSSSRWIVLGGLGLPALILPPLVGYALFAGDRLLFDENAPSVRIEAEARQWTWAFHYPDHGGLTTEDTLFLPSGQTVEMAITSLDVIHSFWIPRLAGKLDAIPGHENTLRLQADAPGELEGLCAEFCGRDHAYMRFSVTVVEPEDLEAAIREAGQ